MDLFSILFKSKKRKTQKRKTKLEIKYHKLKLQHNKTKSKKCCKKCAGINLNKSIKCRMGVYPTCKKSGCKRS